jgi:hypothetical protein
MSTQAPYRERLSGFALLESDDLLRLTRDARTREHYVRALLLMEDIVSELWDEAAPSRFPEDEWERQQTELLAFFDGEDGVSRNVQENLGRARECREEAVIAQDDRAKAFVRREATRFMGALLFTYNQVRLLG